MSGKTFVTVYQVDINLVRAYQEWEWIQAWVDKHAQGGCVRTHNANRNKIYTATLEFDKWDIARDFVLQFQELVDAV